MTNQRNSVSVSRASHVHHVPQIGFAPDGPVVSTTVVNTSPTSAALSARRSARSSRSQRYTMRHHERHQPEGEVRAMNAAGTCR